MATYPRYTQGEPTVGRQYPTTDDRVAGLLDTAIRSLFGYMDTSDQRAEASRRFNEQMGMQRTDQQMRQEQAGVRSRAGAYGMAQAGVAPLDIRSIYGQSALGGLDQAPPGQFTGPGGQTWQQMGQFTGPPPQLPVSPFQPQLGAPSGTPPPSAPAPGGDFQLQPGEQTAPLPQPPGTPAGQLEPAYSPLEGAYRGGMQARRTEARGKGRAGFSSTVAKSGERMLKEQDAETKILGIMQDADAHIEQFPEDREEFTAWANQAADALRAMGNLANARFKAEQSTKVQAAGARAYRPPPQARLAEIMASVHSLSEYNTATRGLVAPHYDTEEALQAGQATLSRISSGKADTADEKIITGYLAANNPAAAVATLVDRRGMSEPEAQAMVESVRVRQAAVREPADREGKLKILFGQEKMLTESFDRLVKADIPGSEADIADRRAELGRVKEERRKLEATLPTAPGVIPVTSETQTRSVENHQAQAIRFANEAARRWKTKRGTGDQDGTMDAALEPFRKMLREHPDRFEGLFTFPGLHAETKEMLAYIKRNPAGGTPQKKSGKRTPARPPTQVPARAARKSENERPLVIRRSD